MQRAHSRDPFIILYTTLKSSNKRRRPPKKIPKNMYFFMSFWGLGIFQKKLGSSVQNHLGIFQKIVLKQVSEQVSKWGHLLGGRLLLLLDFRVPKLTATGNDGVFGRSQCVRFNQLRIFDVFQRSPNPPSPASFAVSLY